MVLPPRVSAAMNAMDALGFSWEATKPVLKMLLTAYDNKWNHIEAENYRVLADAILDSLESRESGLYKDKHLDDGDKMVDDQMELAPSTRPTDTKVIDESEPENKKLLFRMRERGETVSSQIGRPGKGEVQPFIAEKRRETISAHPSSRLERNCVASLQNSTKKIMPQMLANETSYLKRDRKDKWPVHRILDKSIRNVEPMNEYNTKDSALIMPCQGRQELQIHNSNKDIVSISHCNITNASTSMETSSLHPSSINTEVAASASGYVRLLFLLNPAIHHPNFQMPSMEMLCKMVEERCLKFYRVIKPSLSLMSLLSEMCQCVEELSSKSPEEQENIAQMVPKFKSLKEAASQDLICEVNPLLSNGQGGYTNGNNGNSGAVENDSPSLLLFKPPLHANSEMRIAAVCDSYDITRGEENVQITLINGPRAGHNLPSFHYIPRNIVYQNAYVNISLARIGDENCCSACTGDCLAAPIPCACARETGGEYAYTSENLMKKDFLDSIISTKYHWQQKDLYFCKDCPVDRRSEIMPKSCKGHLIRKFVKECWNKCGCSRTCGNRLVQRGITRNLQVFWTTEGKGWGLRTLEELPRGAFVCEYVGEILTNTELYFRQLHVTGKMKHTYPVLLDADWGAEQVLKDEEALCLDATFYGNVARFINHKCADANLIDVPVEVETPDHHYYHLAFFTVRKVEALEELNWDYQIDFDDMTHPIKAFPCRCGSKFCRDRRQIRKKRTLVLG